MEWLFFILISASLHIGFLLYFRRRITRELRAKERIAEIEREIGLLIAQLNGAADRNISILEDRILKLEDLLRRADQRVTLLKGQLPIKEDGVARYREAAKSPVRKEAVAPLTVSSAKELTEPDEMGDKVMRLVREGLSPDRVAHQLGLSVSEVNLIMKLQGVV